MFNLFYFVFILCGVFSPNVKASSLDELKQKYVEMIIECSNDFPITADDMTVLRNKQMPENDSIKCLFACVYKKSGMKNQMRSVRYQRIASLVQYCHLCKNCEISTQEVVYLSCNLRMNDKGELWVEGVNEMTRRYLSDDPEKIKKSEEFTEACKSVNDVAVSDGEKGCDRAALIFKCTVEKSPEFDFV